MILKKQIEQLQESIDSMRATMIEREKIYRSIDKTIFIIEYSYEGMILNANDNYLNISGYSKEDLIGRDVRWSIPSDELEVFNKTWRKVQAGATQVGKIRIATKTGKKLWLIKSDVPVFDEEGKVEKILFIATRSI